MTDPFWVEALAAMRAARSEVAVYALVVDAKDAAAEAFYLHHGFLRFGTKPRQRMLSLAGLHGAGQRSLAPRRSRPMR